jgi:hypothetical protein
LRDDAPIESLGADALAAKLMERPLFLPGRRVPAAPLVEAAPPPEAPMPRLMGVLIAPGAKFGVFQVAGRDKPVVAAVGGRVSQWAVTAIAPDQVTIVGPGGVHTLNPAPDPTAEGNVAAGGDNAAGPD